MMTEAEWRYLSRVDQPKPDFPELIPGLPAENARRIREYGMRLVYYKICRAERLMYGMEI